MATITLRVEGSTVGDISVVRTLSQSDSDRLMAYLVTHYGIDEEGNPRTPAEIVGAYWGGINAGTVANVTRWEQELAAQAAREAITPIQVV